VQVTGLRCQVSGKPAQLRSLFFLIPDNFLSDSSHQMSNFLRPETALLLPYFFPVEVSFEFSQSIAALRTPVMRFVLGAIMIAHGYKKVFGGFHGHQQFVGSLGIPAWMAYLSAGTEFFGGIAIVLGLFTRLSPRLPDRDGRCDRESALEKRN